MNYSIVQREPHKELLALVLVDSTDVAVMAVLNVVVSWYFIVALELGSLLCYYIVVAVRE